MMDALEGNTSVEKHLKQTLFKSTHQTCSIKKVLLNFSQDPKGNTCVGVSFLIKFMKKETPTHVFSGEFWETFKNTFYKTPPNNFSCL